MKQFELTVLGDPVPQGRPRAFVPKGQTRPRVYDPNNARKWKHQLRYAAQQAVEKTDFEMWRETPLTLVLTFYLHRPKSLPKRILYPYKRPDLDNLEKAVMDGLQGVVFDDDSRIVAKQTLKAFHPEGKVGVWITVWEKA